MVGGTTHQPQQAPQLAPPSSSTAPTTTPEEDELLKRNTDCVYFLASPLTCKKGSECEYRHSDIARVNPRDCWYWLNGNCLNPKCGFRHPPLDGLLGTEVSTPMGPSVPAIPKQGVACIFFQKGFCLKGHLCPFLHGPPNSVINKAAQSGPVNHPPTEPPKMAYSHPEKSIPERKFTQKETVQKPVEFLLLPQGKQARNGGSIDKKVAPPSSMDVEEPPRHKSSKSNRGHVLDNNNRIVNGKDGDEYSREPSPGFDVLVDNEVGDSEYYQNEDEFGRCSDMYREQRRVASSERKPYRTTSDSPDESDLRHRIAKQRRGSENRNHSDHMMPRRESHHLSSRLRGRIKIPGRSISPTNRNESRVERVIDMGRKHPARYTSPSFNQSRLRDIIKGRASEDINDARDYYYYKGSRGRQDMMSDSDTTFTGPKRLLNEGYEQQMNDRESQGKRKYPQFAAADDLSFEGPKPLSEILKRKRGADALISSLNNHKEREVISICTNKQEYKSEFSEAEKQTEKDKSLLNYIASEVENEEGLIDEDAMLDQELEAYDDNNGDYNYEQIDGEEDYNLDEGENPDEEYVDDEYAKKESVSYL